MCGQVLGSEAIEKIMFVTLYLPVILYQIEILVLIIIRLLFTWWMRTSNILQSSILMQRSLLHPVYNELRLRLISCSYFYDILSATAVWISNFYFKAEFHKVKCSITQNWLLDILLLMSLIQELPPPPTYPGPVAKPWLNVITGRYDTFNFWLIC